MAAAVAGSTTNQGLTGRGRLAAAIDQIINDRDRRNQDEADRAAGAALRNAADQPSPQARVASESSPHSDRTVAAWILGFFGLVAVALVVLSMNGAFAPPSGGAGTPPPAALGTINNWGPPAESEGIVRRAKETPPAGVLYGQNDPKGQPYCDKYDSGKTFKGWVGTGLARHAFCQ